MSDSIADSREFYQEYFSNQGSLTYGNRERYQLVFDLIKRQDLPRNARVLDIGTGSGRISSFLLDYFDEVLGVDIMASNQMEHLYRNSEDIQFVLGGFPELPVKSDAFDLVVCSEVLEHLETDVQWRATKEISRVLSEEGVAVMSTPNPDSIFDISRSTFIKILSHCGLWKKDKPEGQLVENWIRPDELQKMFERHLKIERHLGSYYNICPLNRVPNTGPVHPLRFTSEFIRDRGWLPDRGLYQYYVVINS